MMAFQRPQTQLKIALPLVFMAALANSSRRIFLPSPIPSPHIKGKSYYKNITYIDSRHCRLLHDDVENYLEIERVCKDLRKSMSPVIVQGIIDTIKEPTVPLTSLLPCTRKSHK